MSKAVATVLVAGGLTLGSFVAVITNDLLQTFSGKVIYEGNVNGYYVTYEEGRLRHLGGERFNRLTASKGGLTYVLEDEVSETPIDGMMNEEQRDYELNPDLLEHVRVTKGRSSKTYHRSSVPPRRPTPEDQITQSTFHHADALYNQLRTSIREQLRADYQAVHEPFLDTSKK